MTQEAIRMRASEDDRVDVRIAVCAINQFFQLFGDRGIKQRMRAAVDTSDKYPGVALNGNVSCGLRVQAALRRLHARDGVTITCNLQVIVTPSLAAARRQVVARGRGRGSGSRRGDRGGRSQVGWRCRAWVSPVIFFSPRSS